MKPNRLALAAETMTLTLAEDAVAGRPALGPADRRRRSRREKIAHARARPGPWHFGFLIMKPTRLALAAEQ